MHEDTIFSEDGTLIVLTIGYKNNTIHVSMVTNSLAKISIKLEIDAVITLISNT